MSVNNPVENAKPANPLGTAPVGRLLIRFAIPAIIAMLVTGLYNIVDQIFIGNFISNLGNGATNIAFPLSMLCTAFSLLFGIGGAANFNLNMGAGRKEEAGRYIGNAATMALLVGLVITTISEVFLEPMLIFFGSTADILPFAMEYTRITAIGFPFLILSISGGHLIRADGKPTVAMLCNLFGALLNTALDALFVIVFKWGMVGAAAATVIGQLFAAGFAAFHLMHFKTIRLNAKDFRPNIHVVLRISHLGMSQGFNQVAMMVVQIVSNNSFRYYGEQSKYGENIPITAVGIISKISMLYFAICIGLSQALQPIASFNYGAGNYGRTRSAYRIARNIGSVVAVIAFIVFQLFPRQIIGLFGHGTELYYEFAVRYMRIFMFCTFINNVQPLTSSFFSSIGKPNIGLVLSMTRQIIFLLPLIIILPLFMGIDGMIYSGPIADGMAFIAAMVVAIIEFRRKEYKQYVNEPEKGQVV